MENALEPAATQSIKCQTDIWINDSQHKTYWIVSVMLQWWIGVLHSVYIKFTRNSCYSSREMRSGIIVAWPKFQSTHKVARSKFLFTVNIFRPPNFSINIFILMGARAPCAHWFVYPVQLTNEQVMFMHTDEWRLFYWFLLSSVPFYLIEAFYSFSWYVKAVITCFSSIHFESRWLM